MKNARERLEKTMPYVSAVAGQRHLLAMREAMIHIVPFTLASSVFVLISRFPCKPYQDFMVLIAGAGWGNWEQDIVRPVMMGIIALLGAASSSMSLSKAYGHDGLDAGFLAVAAYAILAFSKDVDGNLSWGGAEGLWLAMLVGLGTAELQHRLKSFSLWKTETILPQAFVRSVRPMMIAFVIMGISVGIRRIGYLFSQEGLWNVWMAWVQRPFFHIGTSLSGTLLVQGINSFFWGLGLHGAQLVNSVMLPVWMTQTLENMEVFIAGGTVFPHIVTKQFIELFIWIGGSAGSMSMVLWMRIFAKSKHVKNVGKMALLPAIFNIDEPVVFGLPIVLNPILMVPFVLAPVATTLFSYMTIKWGIFPVLCGIDLPWSTPVFISGFLATNGDIRGVILQLCNLGISFLVYAPFIYVYDRRMMLTEA